MKTRMLLLALMLIALFQFQTVALFAQIEERGIPEPRGTEPQIIGIARANDAKSNAPPFANPGSPNLTYHNGPILTAPIDVQPIFWGPKWATSSFSGDKMSGINDFYFGISTTPYILTNHEYTNGGGTQVTTAITPHLGTLDSSAGPNSGNQTAPILAEVCKMITNPSANGYYPVYTDLRRGSAGFCAWHSAGSCSTANGPVNVEFAFFFDLDGDSGCNPGGDTGVDSLGAAHSQGLAALANVSGHELSEALTDPRLNAWYDKQGYENSDKCAWLFGSTLLTFTDKSTWKIQGNWSNAAYNAGTGNAGKRGCIDR